MVVRSILGTVSWISSGSGSPVPSTLQRPIELLIAGVDAEPENGGGEQGERPANDEESLEGRLEWGTAMSTKCRFNNHLLCAQSREVFYRRGEEWNPAITLITTSMERKIGNDGNTPTQRHRQKLENTTDTRWRLPGGSESR